MSDAFIAVLAVTDFVMCIGFYVMGKIIEELEDRYQGIVDALQEKKENNNG